MKKLFLVSATFMAMIPMSAFARGRAGIFFGPAYGPYGYYSYYGSYYGMYPYGSPFGVPNAGAALFPTHFH